MVLNVLTCTGRMDPIMSEVFTVLGCGGSGGGGGGGIAIASMSCVVERRSRKPNRVYLIPEISGRGTIVQSMSLN